MSDLAGIFGHRTWDDLRSLLSAYVGRRFYDLSPEEIDDAVSEAVVDLVDYWVGVPTSLSSDPLKNWHFAIRRARWTLSSFVYARLDQRANEFFYDGYSEGQNPDHKGRQKRGSRPTNEGGDEQAWSLLDHYSYTEVMRAPTDEDETDAQRNLREFLDNLPEDELEKWLQSVLDGETVKKCARRLGLTPAAIKKRRWQGRKRLRCLVDSYGVRYRMKEDA